MNTVYLAVSEAASMNEAWIALLGVIVGAILAGVLSFFLSISEHHMRKQEAIRERRIELYIQIFEILYVIKDCNEESSSEELDEMELKVKAFSLLTPTTKLFASSKVSDLISDFLACFVYAEGSNNRELDQISTCLNTTMRRELGITD